jgi:hypothetical protein
MAIPDQGVHLPAHEIDLGEQADRAAAFVFVVARHAQAGSWLNLVEGFFSKMARSALRHIRVASKKELRGMAAIDYFNQNPVVHTRTYKLDKAA